MMSYHPLNGRGYGHAINFAVRRDAARRAGLSGTVDMILVICY